MNILIVVLVIILAIYMIYRNIRKSLRGEEVMLGKIKMFSVHDVVNFREGKS